MSTQQRQWFAWRSKEKSLDNAQAVMEGGDFIYIGNDWEGVPRAALVVSPPQNDQGKRGYVLCVDGYISTLTPEQVEIVMETPWILATNASQGNIEFLKQGLNVEVPKRFRITYPHAYRAIQ